MKQLEQIELTNQRVLLRADLNAPLKVDQNGQMQITDDGRLKASVETIELLIKKNILQPKKENTKWLSSVKAH